MILRKHIISTAANCLCSSAVCVHDLHAYMKMERTSACTSVILDFVNSAIFLPLQIGFSLATAVDVCADLARISVWDSSSLMMAPRYLNCFTVSSSCPLAVRLDIIVLLLFVIILFLFSSLISIPYLADVSSSRFTRLTSSFLSLQPTRRCHQRNLFCLGRVPYLWLLRTAVRWIEQAFFQRYISSL